MLRSLVLSCAGLLCASAFAADFAIGNMPITLGADKEAVMNEAQSRFTIVPLTGNPDTVFFSDRKAPNINVIGGVTFANGKLVSAQRNWGSFNGKVSPIEIHKALFAALEHATAQSGTQAVVTTSLQRIPGTEFKSIYFEFPGRRVYLSASDADPAQGGKSVSIEEAVFIRK